MSSFLLLMGLLVLAYLGSFLVGERAVRGVGLPSSVEWVVFGFVLGPKVLGLVGASLVDTVEPFIIAFIGWVALTAGIDYGFSAVQRGRPLRIAVAILWGIMTGGAIAAAVYFALPYVWPDLGPSRLQTSLVIAAVSLETTRYVMRWARERFDAKGPLLDLLADLADGEDVVPVILMAIVFALRGTAVHIHVEVGIALTATLGTGIIMGAAVAVLLGREFRVRESWGVLIGTTLVLVGVTGRFGMPIIAVLFVMGLTLALVSRHREDIRTMVEPSERSATLPLLLLVGVRLETTNLRETAYVVGVVIAARIVAKYFAGSVVGLVFSPAKPAGGLAGLTLMSSGSLSVVVAMSYAMGDRGPLGNVVLVTAVAACIAGEVLGPPALKASLRRAGELDVTKTIIPPPAGSEPNLPEDISPPPPPMEDDDMENA